MQEILIKKDILKEGYQKASEKLTLLFLLNPVSFYGQSYQKEKGLELATSCFSGYKTTSKISLTKKLMRFYRELAAS